MSEPNEGERNPFADIIDLFRETADQAPTDDEPASAVRRRRGRWPALLLAVVLLGIAGGATAAMIGHQHHSTHLTEKAPAATLSTAPASPTAVSSVPTPAAPAADPATAAYTSALDGYAAATDVASLRAAAEETAAAVADGSAAGGALHRAEVRHLQALIALASLRPGKQELTGFPAAATAVTASAASVTAVAGADPAVPDPSLATTNAVNLEGLQVAGDLHQRVTALAGDAAKATLTAGLRRVAAEAGRLAGPAGSTAGLLTGASASQTTTDAAALRTLAGLSVVDGDHLKAWKKLAGPLRDALTSAGVARASQDVAAITTMIGRAQQTLLTWRATKKAIRSYAASAQALVGRYTQIIGGLPRVARGQAPSSSLVTRFHRTLKALTSLSGPVARLDPPPGMAGGQQALVSLVRGGGAAALAGHVVAVSAERCDPSTRSCAYGRMRGWPTYLGAIQRLGSPSTVASTIRTAATSALAAATPSATSSTQPKPVV